MGWYNGGDWSGARNAGLTQILAELWTAAHRRAVPIPDFYNDINKTVSAADLKGKRNTDLYNTHTSINAPFRAALPAAGTVYYINPADNSRWTLTTLQADTGLAYAAPAGGLSKNNLERLDFYREACDRMTTLNYHLISLSASYYKVASGSPGPPYYTHTYEQIWNAARDQIPVPPAEPFAPEITVNAGIAGASGYPAIPSGNTQPGFVWDGGTVTMCIAVTYTVVVPPDVPAATLSIWDISAHMSSDFAGGPVVINGSTISADGDPVAIPTASTFLGAFVPGDYPGQVGGVAAIATSGSGESILSLPIYGFLTNRIGWNISSAFEDQA